MTVRKRQTSTSGFATWLFGEKLSEEDRLIREAMKAPRWMRWTAQLSRLAILIVLLPTLFGVERYVPVIGPWLAADEMNKFWIWGGGVLAWLAVDIWDRRRIRRLGLGPERLRPPL